MRRSVDPVVMDVHLPPGVAGPEPLDFDVRCFLVVHASGVVLVDAGMAGSLDAIRAGLERVGARWDDITDVVLTHGHEDHVGGLADVIANSNRAVVWAGIGDHSAIAFEGELRSLVEGGAVRDLRVLQTPGHTPGHCSLVLEEEAILFAGDIAGSMAGRLTRGPAPFIAHPEEAERSLRRVAGLDFDRILFGHGAEIQDPVSELRSLLGAERGPFRASD
jgi:glyoxylase-like metal-dependent hydrolase (beta-lactamase superfamily II)